MCSVIPSHVAGGCCECSSSTDLWAVYTQLEPSCTSYVASSRCWPSRCQDPSNASRCSQLKGKGSSCGQTSGHPDHLSGKPENVRNLTAVREVSGILPKVREVSGKNLVREKWPKTVYCKLHICVHSWLLTLCILFWIRIMHCCIPTLTTDNNTRTGMMWVTHNVGRSAANRQGSVREFHIVWRVVTLMIAQRCVTDCCAIPVIFIWICFLFVRGHVWDSDRLMFMNYVYILYVGTVPDICWSGGVWKHARWLCAEQAAGRCIAAHSITRWFDVVIADITVWCVVSRAVASCWASHSQQWSSLCDQLRVWWCRLLVAGRRRHYSGDALSIQHCMHLSACNCGAVRGLGLKCD